MALGGVRRQGECVGKAPRGCCNPRRGFKSRGGFQLIQDLLRSNTDAPVVGEVFPDDSTLAIDEKNGRPSHVTIGTTLFMTQTVLIDDLAFRVGKQSEFEIETGREFAAVVGRVDADGEHLRFEGFKFLADRLQTLQF